MYTAGVSKSRYFGISIPIKYSNFSRLGPFYKNSDVTSFLIDQFEPGVFYLKKMMNFMKMRTFYKKNYLFFKKLNFASL